MFPHSRDKIDRRSVLRLGTLAGLSLPQILRLQSAQGAAKAGRKDVNCIFIFCIGGMSHHDLWDPKPDAPAEMRGDFTPIATRVPGMQVSNILSHAAKGTANLAILRGGANADTDHTKGYHVMMTGVNPGVAIPVTQNNNTHPSLGSMVARLGRSGSSLPPYISVPNLLNSGGPAFLGATYAPFVIEADPASPDFSVRDIVLPEGVSTDRSVRRQQALREINRFERRVEEVSRSVRSLDTFYEKAYNLMTSREAKEAFDIGREPATLREQYGMTSLGQCCLLGRRMVEAGCRFVSIENGHWDTHRKNTMSLRDLLVPSLDQGVAALLSDLDQRGMLESTLVVVTTEFGRTPRINVMDGRDHWPQAFSIVMAGGGLKTGQVVGATDKIGATVTDRPMTPADMAATVLSVLGIDPSTILHTPQGRPLQMVSGGRPINELI
jgi:uncharacterized protein (DUF1501 family)